MNYWLLKSEPDTWSWQNQVSQGKTGEVWSGVRNHQAANFIKEMKKNDLAFFYHSGKKPSVVGIVKIIKEHFIDPTDDAKKFVAVTVSAVESLSRPVSLKAIKDAEAFDGFLLIKQSRLSVMPVTPAHWNKILMLSAQQ